MHVEFGGSGRGIVLLHGLMGRASTWWSCAQWLREYGRVVGLDARGHGTNPLSASGASTEDFADDIAAAVDDLDLGASVLIGHSMGGLHALAVAARRPDLVRAVVVEDFAPDLRGRSVADWRPIFDAWPSRFVSLAHVREVLGGGDRVIGDYFAECVREDADGYRLIADQDELVAIAHEWTERDYWELVEAVRCPALVVEGGGGLMPQGQMASMAERLRDGRYVYVEGGGHLVHDAAPQQYRKVVSGFLDAVL